MADYIWSDRSGDNQFTLYRDHRWNPSMDETKIASLYHFWKKAVTRSFDWVE